MAFSQKYLAYFTTLLYHGRRTKIRSGNQSTGLSACERDLDTLELISIRSIPSSRDKETLTLVQYTLLCHQVLGSKVNMFFRLHCSFFYIFVESSFSKESFKIVVIFKKIFVYTSQGGRILKIIILQELEISVQVRCLVFSYFYFIVLCFFY